MTTPPPLAWIPSFSESLSRALEEGVSARVDATVNPLVYQIVLVFQRRVEDRNMMLIWNLFQKYATANKCHPYGKLEKLGFNLTIKVSLERRNGFPSNTLPE